MKKILIVNANYYKNISSFLIKAAKKTLINYETHIIHVPGIFEIPITLRRYIKKYDGFVALGCVIKGETPHFDLICKSSFDSILRISVEFNKPVGNGIITALNMDQAKKRSSLDIKILKPNKGSEAAKAVISVLNYGPNKT